MLLAAFTACFLAAGIFYFGRRRAGYSHVRHTISELGEKGAIDANLVSWGLFFPVGIAMALTWYNLRETHIEVASLAGVLAVGYVGGAVFPCDAGCPFAGSFRQAMHNLAGGVEYFGGIMCLFALSRDAPIYLAPAIFVAVATLLISVPFPASVRGLVQRLAEGVLFGSLVLALATMSAA
jgi:hypothetical protein